MRRQRFCKILGESSCFKGQGEPLARLFLFDNTVFLKISTAFLCFFFAAAVAGEELRRVVGRRKVSAWGGEVRRDGHCGGSAEESRDEGGAVSEVHEETVVRLLLFDNTVFLKTVTAFACFFLLQRRWRRSAVGAERLAGAARTFILQRSCLYCVLSSPLRRRRIFFCSLQRWCWECSNFFVWTGRFSYRELLRGALYENRQREVLVLISRWADFRLRTCVEANSGNFAELRGNVSARRGRRVWAGRNFQWGAIFCRCFFAGGHEGIPFADEGPNMQEPAAPGIFFSFAGGCKRGKLFGGCGGQLGISFYWAASGFHSPTGDPSM